MVRRTDCPILQGQNTKKQKYKTKIYLFIQVKRTLNIFLLIIIILRA